TFGMEPERRDRWHLAPEHALMLGGAFVGIVGEEGGERRAREGLAPAWAVRDQIGEQIERPPPRDDLLPRRHVLLEAVEVRARLSSPSLARGRHRPTTVRAVLSAPSLARGRHRPTRVRARLSCPSLARGRHRPT